MIAVLEDAEKRRRLARTVVWGAGKGRMFFRPLIERRLLAALGRVAAAQKAQEESREKS